MGSVGGGGTLGDIEGALGGRYGVLGGDTGGASWGCYGGSGGLLWGQPPILGCGVVGHWGDIGGTGFWAHHGLTMDSP